ncbi:hypothetical protein ACIA49_32460 [Kribbella sp. NPDC051587]|uniref:hypothetical protein n=1 Tax=Kribbella sp. NPDC051587 TaxID=3364119 RepID=UPI003797B4FC
MTIVAAAVLALGTLIGGVAAFVKHDDGPANSDNTGTVGNNGCNINGDQSSCTVQQIMGDETLTDPEFRKEMAKASTAAPAGAGPYQFVVVDTGKLGLMVRTGPEADDEQFGSVGNRGIVWADCQQRSSFNGDPSMGVGPVWLKIHWPQTTGKEFANSQPKDPARGWVFRGYVIPAGHNGKIPNC